MREREGCWDVQQQKRASLHPGSGWSSTASGFRTISGAVHAAVAIRNLRRGKNTRLRLSQLGPDGGQRVAVPPAPDNKLGRLDQEAVGSASLGHRRARPPEENSRTRLFVGHCHRILCSARYASPHCIPICVDSSGGRDRCAHAPQRVDSIHPTECNRIRRCRVSVAAEFEPSLNVLPASYR